VTDRVVLTLDLGTSATKAALWVGAELVGLTRAPLVTTHPAPDRAEQDPGSWWTSVVDACAALRTDRPEEFARIDTLACSAARETFALVADDLTPIGPGILWSDHRATPSELATLGDFDEFRRETGVMPTAGCAAAKAVWVARHVPDRFAAARWLLAPRDLVVARLTGAVLTDPSLASRTGWVSLAGLARADDALAARLPVVVPSTRSLPLRPSAWSRAAGLADRLSVVPGAGDRACEALGSGATAACPMVSWGTTANVSVPHPGPVARLPQVAQVSRAADDTFLVEAGLAAAGSALDWLATLTGRSVDDLWATAGSVPPGARGVRAFPWFAGARAPHWRGDATAAFVGLRPEHTPAELARAMVEGVAFDVARSIELLDSPGTELVVTGGGAANNTWTSILGGAVGRTIVLRRHAEAASVGARLLAARSAGEDLVVDALNPVVDRRDPDATVVAEYAAARTDADRCVHGLLDGASSRWRGSSRWAVPPD
jgi:xylulokinase